MGRLSKGETVAEIAADCGVSPRSVYRMAARARVALGARTNRQAMANWSHGYQREAEVTTNEGELRDRLKAQREYLEVAGWHDV